jgi:hypothetical protein
MAALDNMERATKDAMFRNDTVECIQHPKSTAPPAAIEHVRDTIVTTLLVPILRDLINVCSRVLAESIRPHLDKEMLQPHLLRNSRRRPHFEKWRPWRIGRIHSSSRRYLWKLLISAMTLAQRILPRTIMMVKRHSTWRSAVQHLASIAEF